MHALTATPINSLTTTSDVATACRPVAANALRLDSSRPTASVVIVRARGDIDASNADDLAAYVHSVVAPRHGVVLDLSNVDFISLAGLAVLQELNEWASSPLRLAVLPNRGLLRLLQLCPLEPSLVVVGDIGAAIAAVQAESTSLLHLVAQ
jgi:anti-anti-sigma factor